MPSPVYSAGTPGNLINGIPVAKSTTIAAFLDLSTCIEGQVSCEMTTGSSPLGAGTTFSAYKVYGNSAANTLSTAAAIGSTSLSVSNSAGLHSGQRILLQQATGAKAGEIATISGTIGGTGPYTVPILATINSYLAGDAVYLIDQTATATVTPSTATGSWSTNADYSNAMFLGTGQWAIAASNADTSQSVTVTVTVDKITSYQ